MIWLIATPLLAQKSEADKLVKLADEMYEFGDPKDAKDLYVSAITLDPANVRANFMAGKTHLETTDKPGGLEYFLKTYELDYKYSDKILFYIAQCYHFGHDFDNAIIYYKKHQEQAEKDYKSKVISREQFAEIEKLVERKLFECKNGKQFVSTPRRVKIEGLGRKINSRYAEYTPAVTADESTLIFTSRRAGTTGGLKANDNEYFEDIYISHKEDGKWQKAKNIGEPINGQFHDAVISVSANGDQIYLYKDENNGDIYKSEKVGDKWGVPQPLKEINTKDRENHITASAEGDVFIFASNRKGGYGKLDLYRVEVNAKGKWGKPQNLGNVVNTDMNEESPYLDLDGKT